MLERAESVRTSNPPPVTDWANAGVDPSAIAIAIQIVAFICVFVR